MMQCKAGKIIYGQQFKIASITIYVATIIDNRVLYYLRMLLYTKFDLDGIVYNEQQTGHLKFQIANLQLTTTYTSRR